MLFKIPNTPFDETRADDIDAHMSAAINAFPGNYLFRLFHIYFVE